MTTTPMPCASRTTRPTGFPPPSTAPIPSAQDDWPRVCGSARSMSTAESGTRPICRSAATSSRASAARWAWPASRSTCRPRPSPRQASRRWGRYRRSGTIVGGDMSMPTTELTTSLTPSANAEAVVDLAAIEHNVRVLREHAGSSQVMAVVKADGYGHGATQVARSALAAGAAEIGVATVDEALALRADGITAPVLAWLHPPGIDFDPALLADVEIAVSSERQLEELLDAARRTGRTATVTVKVDTGLNRNGVPLGHYPSMLTALRQAVAEDAVRLRGLMSHMVFADEPDNPINNVQAQRFTDIVAQTRDQGVHFEVAHR